MKPSGLLAVFCVAVAAFSAQAVWAAPKAAEHEDAPVTHGADVPKPKPAVKSVQPVKRHVAPHERPTPKGKAAKKGGKARTLRK